MCVCKHCGSERKSLQSKVQHERFCTENPDRVEHPRGMLGKKGANQFTTGSSTGHSRLARAHISQGQRGRTQSGETRDKISKAMRGKPQSEETRAKRSESRKRFLEKNPYRPCEHCGRKHLGAYGSGKWCKKCAPLYTCSHCGSVRDSRASLAQHSRLCPSNPNRDRNYLVENPGVNGFEGRTHSPETRSKIGLARRKYLQENPDQVPYLLNHKSGGPSYPERYWKEVLTNAGVAFEEQYPLGSYHLDFAFPGLMVDLEIDGSQHWLDPKMVGHDQKRDAYMKNLGWRVVRVRWADFKRLPPEERRTYVKNLLEGITL